jgi:hypothetical protein
VGWVDAEADADDRASLAVEEKRTALARAPAPAATVGRTLRAIEVRRTDIVDG